MAKSVKDTFKTTTGEGFNVASTATNDDWLRAARLLRAGKTKQLAKLDNTQMKYRSDKLIKTYTDANRRVK